MSRTHRGGRSRAGFTLAEVLVALGILVALLGVAIPGVAAIRANLKMAELDAYAREIYVAAQNRLVALRSTGELDALPGAEMTEPSDFNATGLTWDSSQYVYVTPEDAGLLLPAGSIDAAVRGGHYIIEYNRSTAMVYGVFYAEDSFSYPGDAPRERPARKTHTPMLGYYGGSGVKRDPVDQCELPDFEIVNGERLTVELTAIPTTQASAHYVITVAEVGTPDSAASISFTNGDSGFDNLSFAGGKYTLVLDSLESEMHLQNLYPAITPGADLSVTVSVSIGNMLPATLSKWQNSLFASRDGDTVTVSNGRHLQNLEYLVSGCDDVVAAVQGGPIDWADAQVDHFRPINTSMTSLRSFNGGGQVISHLNILGNNDKNLGLFGTVDRMSVQNVRLADPNIRYMGFSAAAGALAGAATDSRFENCQVYAEHDFASGIAAIGAVGGLIGSATSNCVITECSASLPSINAPSSTAGGLVGLLDGSAVSRCYADTGVYNEETGAWTGGIRAAAAGGLIGSASEAEISDCYALGCLSAAKSAGLLLNASGPAPTLSRCYAAAVFAEGAGQSYGLSDGRAAGSYYWAGSKPATPAAAQEKTLEELRTCFSRTDESAWRSASASTTISYGRQGVYPFLKLNGLRHYGDWPEEAAADLGDWRLAYYEYAPKGDGNTYRYYADVGYQSGAPLDDLRRDDVPIVEDGYAILCPDSVKPPDPLTVTYSTGARGTATLKVNISGRVTIGGVKYCAYRFPPNSEVMTKSAPNGNLWDYYRTLTIDGVDAAFYFNPYFAKTAVNGADSAPELPDQIEIRTARHLAELGKRADHYSTYWGRERHYLQTHAVDFSTYTSPRQTLSPIGVGTVPFSGSYDGGGHVITGAGIDAPGVSSVGLFGYLYSGGTVENVVFVSDLSGNTARAVTGGQNVGALVGYNAGTVKNCAVAGFQVSGTGFVGGFVGRNDGSGRIEHCSAANGSFGGGSLGGSVRGGSAVGGFAGYQGGTISDCYAVARVFGDTTCYGFAGDLQASVSNSYCAALDGETGSYLDFASAISWAWKSNCYALGQDGNLPEPSVLGAAWGSAAASGTFPYVCGGAYPFPAVVERGGAKVHYGDWPLEEFSDAWLAYYEVYRDDKDGGYTLGLWCESEGIRTLRDDRTAVLDGYGVLFTSAADLDGSAYNGGKAFRTLSELADSLNIRQLKAEGGGNNGNIAHGNNGLSFGKGSDKKTYHLGLLDYATVVSSPAVDGFYHTLTVTRNRAMQVFSFNPHFAKSPVFTGAGAAEQAPPSQVIIRTERQLAKLGRNSAYWGLSILQERDLALGADGQKYACPYAKSYLGVSLPDDQRRLTGSRFLGDSAAPFTGVYDGGGHAVSGHSAVTGADASGLFGRASGAAIRNLTLEDSRLSTGDAGALRVGALLGAGENVTLKHITVTDAQVKGRAMVGTVAGFLSGCEVEDVRVTGGTAEAARLVGGTFGQVVNEKGEVSLSGISVAGTGVTSFWNDSARPDYPAANTAQSYGTGGLLGAAILRGRDDFSVEEVALTGVTVTLERIVKGDAYYAGGMVIGSLYQNQAASEFELEDVALSGGSLDGRASGEYAWYGGLIGRIQAVGTVELEQPALKDFSLNFTPDAADTGSGASLGGCVGAVTALGGGLTLRVDGGTWDGVPVTAAAQGTRAGGFAGYIGQTVSVSGLTLSKPVVTGDGGPTGGFAGLCEGGVRQISVQRPTVGARDKTGGAIGGFAGVLAGSAVSCDVRGGGRVRGADASAAVGGFAGVLTGSAERCFAAVGVTQGGDLGGFAGRADGARLSACYASGAVTGGSSLGGFVGRTLRSDYRDCYASGDVACGAGAAYGGGFLGYMDGGLVLSCYSAGTVTAMGAGQIGGFVGWATLDTAAFPTQEQQKQIAAFYDMLRTVKIVNRDDARADKVPGAEWTFTEASLNATGPNRPKTVWDYLKKNQSLPIDSGVVAFSIDENGDITNPAVTGSWDPATGRYQKYGAASYCLYTALKAYDAGNHFHSSLSSSVWRIVWDPTEGEGGAPVIYWTTETLARSGQRAEPSQVVVYRYSGPKAEDGGFSVGVCSTKLTTEFGLTYPVLADDFRDAHLLPLAVYRYVPNGGDNEGYDDDSRYRGSIARWDASQLTDPALVAETLPGMKPADGGGYRYPLLPGVGCGVDAGKYIHFSPDP